MATNESFVAHPELCCEGLSIKRLGWRICGYRYCCADRSSRRSGWNADGSCYENLSTGRHRCGWCTTVKKRRDRAWNRSSRQSSEPQTCFARCDGPRVHYGSVPPPPPCFGLHTVRCGTLAHLVCCCCCAVPVPVLVLLIAAGFHPR